MPAGAASRYALGAGGVGAVRPAPTASLISASRYALGARRTALRGRCAPVCRAAQPLAAIAATRYALGADGVGAVRPGACGSPVAASRCALGADGVGAARPGACMCPRRRALALGGGHVVVEDAVRFALLETLGARRASRSCRGRGWGGVFQTSSCTSVRGNVRATAACAVRVGAPRHCNRSALPPGQADPPHFERARAAARRLRGAS